jgi:hypothetical protein
VLGELIGESKGKRTGRRVLSTSPGFRVEVSFEDSGKLLGQEFNGITTYSAGGRADGSLYGEGEGVFLLQNGENATLKGAGVGTVKAGGAVSYRGAVYFSTASAALARLNSVAAVFEFEVDASGNTHSKFWEWK